MVDLILILATIPFPLPFMCIAHRPTMSLPDVTVASNDHDEEQNAKDFKLSDRYKISIPRLAHAVHV